MSSLPQRPPAGRNPRNSPPRQALAYEYDPPRPGGSIPPGAPMLPHPYVPREESGYPPAYFPAHMPGADYRHAYLSPNFYNGGPGMSRVHPPEQSFPPPPPAPAVATAAASAPSGDARVGRPKKKARGSVSRSGASTPPPPADNSTKGKPNGKGKGRAVVDKEPDNVEQELETTEHPAVLVREKKQKACSNCRRAKLKCMLDDGETDCVRCKSRREKCVFYPRNYDEDWQQVLTQDVYSALSHLATLTSTVQHIYGHLVGSGNIPPLVTARGDGLASYQAPERDVAMLQGWSGDRNKDLPGPGERKRKAAESSLDESEPNGETVPQEAPNVEAPPVWIEEEPPRQLFWDNNLSLNNPDFSPTIPEPRHPPSSFTMPVPPLEPLSSPVIAFRTDTNNSVHRTPEMQRTFPTPGSMPTSSPSIGHTREITAPQQARPVRLPLSGPLAPPDIILGSQDSRQDVITKGIVQPHDAVVLVNYSHHHLGMFLYGYRLEFGEFPYLPQGPATITPFILAVLCMLGSQRIHSLSHLREPLEEAVKGLLLDSPSESWQSIKANENNRDGQDDELDPELGIGPEEIIGAAVLSMWISDRGNASWIAASAFRWARGWIKMLDGPPRNSIAEIAGIVPAERQATTTQKLRVWLFCYVTQGTERLVYQPEEKPTFRHDPIGFCDSLVPDPAVHPPSPDTNLHDIILTSHARLLFLMSEWQVQREKISCRPPSDARSKELQRLTTRVDGRVNAIREATEQALANEHEHWPAAKQVELFALYARTMIYNNLTEPDLQPRQRGASIGTLMDVGMEMLEKWARWEPREEITNMPHAFCTMMSSVSRMVFRLIVAASKSDRYSGCLISPDDAWPLLQDLGEALLLGELPANHASRLAGHDCLKQAAELKRLAGYQG